MIITYPLYPYYTIILYPLYLAFSRGYPYTLLVLSVYTQVYTFSLLSVYTHYTLILTVGYSSMPCLYPCYTIGAHDSMQPSYAISKMCNAL
jgi:hypothetical protein